jgi:hypothetical protein
MPIKWCTIAPVHYEDHLEVPCNLANGVVLSPSPDWLKKEEILKDLGLADRENLTRHQYALMKEYDANSLGEPDPEWHGKTPRSKQDAALEMIQLADLALWLASPSSIGFSRIIVADFRTGTWSRVEFTRVDPLLPRRKDLDNEVKKGDLESATELHSGLAALAREGAVWISARTLWAALKQEEWTVRYLMLWIVLEALFGPKEGKEITYRLSQRLAFFLSPNRMGTQKLFEAAKVGYGWRSRVVHGMRLGRLSPDKAEDLLYEAEDFARKSLNIILKDPEWTKKFSGRDREKYLDDLVFSA